MAANPIFLGSIRNNNITLTSANTINTVYVLYTGGTSGSRVYNPIIATNITASTYISLYRRLGSGGNENLMKTVTASAFAGTAGIGAITNTNSAFFFDDASSPSVRKDTEGNYYMDIASNEFLSVAFSATTGLGPLSKIYITIEGGDY